MNKRTIIGIAIAVVWATGVLVLASHAAEGPASPGAGAGTNLPRTPDGRPDFNGFWNGGGRAGGTLREDGSAHASFPARDGDVNNFERDFAVLTRAHTNKPLYKPEHWKTIQDLDYHGMTKDPTFGCGPSGVPRLGPPEKIVQTAAEMIFLYDSGVYRIIPTDGRKHEEAQVNDTAPNGYSVGHWEGDTLVIDSVGFDDVTWLGWTGYIHTNEMKVTERITRNANSLTWVATVDDPMLQEPWTMDPVVKQFNQDPKAWFWGVIPCKERDADQIVQKNVRG